MPPSRLPKEASKLLDHASVPRRSTRSLSRFAYVASDAKKQNGNRITTTSTPDIEDSISPPAKRRRRTTSTDLPVKTEKVLPESPPRRAKKPPGRKSTTTTTNVPTTASPPPGWEEVYAAVKKMRSPGGAAYGAAVDTMGCERLADKTASPRDQRFHTLIALMLSSQTKDTVNAAAMHRLKTELPPCSPGAPAGLNLENVLAVDADLLNELIWAVGFHNNKTKYIKQAAVILRDKFASDIPNTIEALTSLPGVGPKMGYLCLSAAWDKTEGIGVDVHVHRITNLWGWHRTKTPEETRLALQAWLPRDRWREINSLLVGLGQAVCLPVGRRCGDCDLAARGLCRAAVGGKKAKGKVEDAGVVVKEEEER